MAAGGGRLVRPCTLSLSPPHDQAAASRGGELPGSTWRRGVDGRLPAARRGAVRLGAAGNGSSRGAHGGAAAQWWGILGAEQAQPLKPWPPSPSPRAPFLWPGACPIAPTLGAAHQVFEVLVDLLTVQQPEDRRLAAQLLGVRLDAAAVTALRVAARDTNASVRVQALNALGKLHDAQTPSRGLGRGRSCSRCLVGPARPKPGAHY